ncbi:membrane steroid-binding protein 2 [Selaginella moellendorffii]|nr:membrane steroid-binding protein 2 [Selaginella moellendorffii]|eukprot:XP_002989334.2 membrane steroid-binding protein 2 [Selaginella moellendorffii]
MDQLREMAHNMSSLAAQGMDYIESNTGLPPIVLFTIIALLLGAYYLISGILAPSQIGAAPLSAIIEEEEEEAAAAAAAAVDPPSIVELGDQVTLLELAAYDGKDSSKPLLMAIKGTIYNVSSARDFYGPGGPYAVFAGRDASRALAKMSFDEGDLCGDLDGLSSQQLEVLKDWESKFASKYPRVGAVKPKKEDKVVDDSSIGMEMEGDEKKYKDSDETKKSLGEKDDQKVSEEHKDAGQEHDSEDETTVTTDAGVRDRYDEKEESFNSSSAA